MKHSWIGKISLRQGRVLIAGTRTSYTETRNADMSFRDVVKISMSLPLFSTAEDWKGIFRLMVDIG